MEKIMERITLKQLDNGMWEITTPAGGDIEITALGLFELAHLVHEDSIGQTIALEASREIEQLEEERYRR